MAGGKVSSLAMELVPRITRVSTAEQGLTALASHPFDLVITMTSLADVDPNAFGRRIKKLRPGLPVLHDGPGGAGAQSVRR